MLKEPVMSWNACLANSFKVTPFDEYKDDWYQGGECHRSAATASSRHTNTKRVDDSFRTVHKIKVLYTLH